MYLRCSNDWGNRMNASLDFSPFFGWPITIGAGLLGLALVAVLFLARTRGSLIRVLTLALLTLALANPSLRQDDRQYLDDIAVVIVDESDSQSLGGRKEQTAAALAAIEAQVKRLGNIDLRVARFRSGATPETDGTRLFGQLNEVIGDIPPERYAGAVLLTDGLVHDVPADAALSKLIGPVHGVLTGSRKEIDRRVVIERSPRFAITGQPQTIQFKVEDSGSEPVNVTITAPDGTVSSINVEPNVTTDISVTLERAGSNILELSVPVREGEISDRNNRAMAIIQGIRDRLRVLLVSGEPHPGERTWRNMLKADASVDLVHFTILRPPEKQDGTLTKELSLIAFPTRELFIDKIDEFDLVIFDRYKRQAIVPEAYLANIAEYVRRGGAVLISSGPDFAAGDGLFESPLADIIAAQPNGRVIEAPFKPQLTNDGQKHPVTRKLPGGGKTPSWGRWFRVVDSTADAPAMTLMAGPEERPLLVLSRADNGRVAQVLSDHGWLWARGFEGGGPQSELLRRIAHWLMKEPDLEEEALIAKQIGGFIDIERRTMADTAEPVTITLPSGAVQTAQMQLIEPGIFKGRVGIAETGVHRFKDSTMQAAAAIGNADAKEMSDLRATENLLKPAAAATGSGVFWFEDGMPRIAKANAGSSMAGSGWLAFRANNQFKVTAVREIPLYSTLLALAALLLVASAMWYREGR
jgi:hypothetical protein